MKALVFSLVMLFVADAHAAPISYNNVATTNENGVAMFYYKTAPNSGTSYLAVPATIELSGDDETGQLTVNRMELHDLSGNLLFAVPPLSVTLEPIAWRFVGDAIPSAIGDLLVTMYPRHVSTSFTGWGVTVAMREKPIINAPLIPGFPWLTTFELLGFQVQVPEPATWLLALGAIAGVAAFRRRAR